MTSNEFCYWLKGYFELSGEANLTVGQVQLISHHLNLVFNKVTPAFRVTTPTKSVCPEYNTIRQSVNPVPPFTGECSALSTDSNLRCGMPDLDLRKYC